MNSSIRPLNEAGPFRLFRPEKGGKGMIRVVAYIICEPCIGTKDTACVDVCPVDCIHPRKDEAGFAAAKMLYIHPDECIDCGACVPACPVEAIFSLDETPEKWVGFIAENQQYYYG